MNTTTNFVATKKVTRFSNETTVTRNESNKANKKARKLARQNKRISRDIV